MGLYHIFTPDTLDYLHRGGRVSALVAVAAGLLDIKLVMRVDEHGHLVPLDKVRGRKRAIKRLVEELVAHRVPDAIGGRVGICNSICPDDVAALTEILKRDHGVSEVVVGPIGATIGTHTGPGCIGLFFAGPQGRQS
jgi:DegV family protein with EDD domain